MLLRGYSSQSLDPYNLLWVSAKHLNVFHLIQAVFPPWVCHARLCENEPSTPERNCKDVHTKAIQVMFTRQHIPGTSECICMLEGFAKHRVLMCNRFAYKPQLRGPWNRGPVWTFGYYNVSHKQGQFIYQRLGSFDVAKGNIQGHNLLPFVAKWIQTVTCFSQPPWALFPDGTQLYLGKWN